MKLLCGISSQILSRGLSTLWLWRSSCQLRTLQPSSCRDHFPDKRSARRGQIFVQIFGTQGGWKRPPAVDEMMIPWRLCLAFLLFSLGALATRPGPSAKRPETVPSSHPAVQSAARFALTEYLKRGAFSSTISAWKGSSIEVVRVHGNRRGNFCAIVG